MDERAERGLRRKTPEVDMDRAQRERVGRRREVGGSGGKWSLVRCMCVYMYVCMSVFECVRARILKRGITLHTHTHTHTHKQTHTHTTVTNLWVRSSEVSKWARAARRGSTACTAGFLL